VAGGTKQKVIMNEKPHDNEGRIALREYETEEALRSKITTCSICFRPIPSKRGWTLGNNAAPVNEGRCCDICNDTVVIPARLNQAMARLNKEKEDV
jgi:hypothetical protein